MNDAFISYSGANRDTADQIATDLAESGLRIWYCKELLTGDDWLDRLEREMRRCRFVLVLLSPDYVRSESAQRELEAAVIAESEGGARVIPILIEETALPHVLANRRYADVRRDFDKGMAMVKEALTTVPARLERSRASLGRHAAELLGVLLSLIAAAISVVSMIGRAPNSVPFVTVSISVSAAVVLTALVAFISAFRPFRRSRPLQTVTRGVEHAYSTALNNSHLNPIRLDEATND